MRPKMVTASRNTFIKPGETRASGLRNPRLSCRRDKVPSNPLIQLRLPRTLLLLCLIFLALAKAHAFNQDPRAVGTFTVDEFNANPDEIKVRMSGRELQRKRSAASKSPAVDLDVALSSTIEKAHSGGSFGMPRAFDTSLGSNFTAASCPRFFKQFLDDPSFTSCAAVSLMLQTSASFFDDTKSKNKINKVLDVACAAPLKACSSIMRSIAEQILSPSACFNDYQDQNPVVLQAWQGLISYDAVFQATCLRNTDHGSDGSFCYADAVTNASSPTSSYIYYLPLGVKLPAGSMPTCNSCLQRTMSGYAKYATNSSQPLSKTYLSAATRVNSICGPGFAVSQITVVNGAAAQYTATAGAWLVTLLATLVILF